jgi:hypothetical protein
MATLVANQGPNLTGTANFLLVPKLPFGNAFPETPDSV